MTSRTWCFTYFIQENDFDENSVPQQTWIVDLENNKENFKACTAQVETCPTSSREHIQGVVRFKQSVRYRGAQERICPGTDNLHVEICRDSRGSRRYCSKPETRSNVIDWRVDWGWERPQGERTDLQSVANALKEGKTYKEISNEYPVQFIKYFKGIKEWVNLNTDPYDGPRQVYIYYGEPGTGKTRRARTIGSSHFIANPPGSDGKMWYDGYAGQETIIFDDFYGWIKWTFLLRICDRNPLMLPIKGGMSPNLAKYIIFTSNSHPENWYKYDHNKRMDAFIRRVDQILHFTRLGEYDAIQWTNEDTASSWNYIPATGTWESEEI